MVNVNVNFENTKFHSGGYEKEIDHPRLTKQLGAIYNSISDGGWFTLRSLAYASGAPEASASAALRSLRNEHGYIIEKKRNTDKSGTWLYRLAGRTVKKQKKKMKPVGDKVLFGAMMQAMYAYANCRDLVNLMDLRTTTDNWQEDFIERIKKGEE